jgi:hypothetical protein
MKVEASGTSPLAKAGFGLLTVRAQSQAMTVSFWPTYGFRSGQNRAEESVEGALNLVGRAPQAKISQVKAKFISQFNTGSTHACSVHKSGSDPHTLFAGTCSSATSCNLKRLPHHRITPLCVGYLNPPHFAAA